MIAEPGPLEQMLARLKLTAIRDQLDSLLDEAAKGELTLRETLTLLCEREIARKDERRIEMATVDREVPVRARSRRLRLQGPALARSEADPRSRDRPVHRQRRDAAAARPARSRFIVPISLSP